MVESIGAERVVTTEYWRASSGASGRAATTWYRNGRPFRPGRAVRW